MGAPERGVPSPSEPVHPGHGRVRTRDGDAARRGVERPLERRGFRQANAAYTASKEWSLTHHSALSACNRDPSAPSNKWPATSPSLPNHGGRDKDGLAACDGTYLSLEFQISRPAARGGQPVFRSGTQPRGGSSNQRPP